MKTIDQANALLDGGLLAMHNRLFAVPPRDRSDAHRAVGTAFNVAAIMSVQEQRTLANDYTVRFENWHYTVGQTDLSRRTRRQGGDRDSLGREHGDPFW